MVLSLVLLAVGVVGTFVSATGQLRARRRAPRSALEHEPRPVRKAVGRAVARGELPADPRLRELAVSHARSQAPLEWLVVQQIFVGLLMVGLLPLQEPRGGIDVLLLVAAVLVMLGSALMVRGLLGARRVLAAGDSGIPQ